MPTRMPSPSVSTCFQLGCRGAVGEHEGLVLANPPGWNRGIGVAEAHEWSRFIIPSHQPEDAPATIDDWIGQRHPTSALVHSGQRDIRVGYVKDRISRYQGGGMAVRPEAQVNEIEDRWRAGDLQESSGVGLGCG